MKIKELPELANIKELKVGPVYIMLLPEADCAKDLEDFSDLFDPADVRMVIVPDPSTIRIFELEPKDETNSKP